MQSPLKKLYIYFKDKKSKIIEASIYSVLNKIFDIAPPLLIGLAVDTVVKGQESFIAHLGVSDKVHQIYWLGFVTFLIWVLESVFEYLFKVKWRNIAQEVQHSLRIDGHKHLQEIDLSFFENQNTGNLTTIINDDVNQLERFLNIGINEIIQLLTAVLSIGAIFFYISPTIAVLSFLPTPFIILGSIYFQKKIAPAYKEVRGEAGLLASIITNNLSGISTVKSFVAENFEEQRLRKQSLKYCDANKKAILLSSLFSPLIRIIILCGFLFTLVLGGIHVFEGKLDVGSYSTLIFLVQRLLWPLTRLGEIIDLYQRSIASAQRVLDLLAGPIKIDDGTELADASSFSGEIKFENVHFSYETGSEVLSDINLKLEPGKTIALVGATGSGKSTLAKLLLRFYDVTKGVLRINGKDIKNFNQKSLRTHIGFVSQDAYLFHGTIRENILYGSFDKSDQELDAAAKLAEAHDFILDMPQGYETIVGERGQKLSGGQKQRISIARAFIKNPALFIFDEATSAIDNETEQAIQRSLKKLIQGRTTVMIAHRLSTIKDASCIYVVDRGRITESGTHAKLIEQKGIYHSLWNVQTGYTENQ